MEARLALESGDLAGAEQSAREAQRLAAETDMLNEQASSARVLGDVLAAAGRQADARDAYASALELFRQKGNVAAAASLGHSRAQSDAAAAGRG